MLTKNWKCLAVLCALTLSLTAVQARAASIGYDPGPTTMLAGDTAGVVSQGNWNSLASTGSNLIDSTGAATTLDRRLRRGQTWDSGFRPSAHSIDVTLRAVLRFCFGARNGEQETVSQETVPDTNGTAGDFSGC